MDALRSHVLGVTRENAKARIERIVANFQTTMPAYKVSLRFTDVSIVRGLLRLPQPNIVGSGRACGLPARRPSMRSAFDDNFHEVIPVEIGIGFVPDKGYIPDAMFAKLVAVTYHELRHVNQAFSSSKSDSYQDQFMSLQRLAVRNNPSFYAANHGRLMAEIDADMTACEGMVAYMRREFPLVEKSDLDSIIVQGFMLSNDDRGLVRYDDPKLTTPEQLGERLKQSAKRAMTSMPKFSTNYYKCDDELAGLFKSKSGLWSDIRDEVEASDSAREAYLKLASIQCFLHPYMRAYYPNVHEIDMAHEHVFKAGLPESRAAALKHVSIFCLEPYEFLERFLPVAMNALPRFGVVRGSDVSSGEVEYPEPRCSSGRDTSDLDKAYGDVMSFDTEAGHDDCSL